MACASVWPLPSKKLFLSYICNKEEDSSSLPLLFLDRFSVLLRPPRKSGLPISPGGSAWFLKRAYPIYEEGLSDFRGGSSRFCDSLYPLCKTCSPAMQKTFVRSVKSLCPIELLQACSNSRPGLQYPSCSPIREYIMICPSPLAVARCGDGCCWFSAHGPLPTPPFLPLA